MVDPSGLATQDPLGIGGLLGDSYRLAQLEQHGASSHSLVGPLLEAARVGLQHYVEQPDLRLPARQRLAFRELGLAIGLAAVEHDRSPGPSRAARTLARYLPLRAEIEAFWLQTEHRQVDSWLEHADINDVMLATSLHPQGFLVIPTRSQT